MTNTTYEPLENAPYVLFTVEDTGRQYRSSTSVEPEPMGIGITTTTGPEPEPGIIGWNLVLNGFEIADAVARKYEVTVPGRDGTLDLSNALGGVYYENRRIEMSFSCVNYIADMFHVLASDMRNALDGKIVRAEFSHDTTFFWRGRAQVDAKWCGRWSKISVTVDAEPFKYNVTSSYDPWLWDTFNFYSGIITQASDIELTGETVSEVLPADPARGKPTLWLNTGNAQARLSTEKVWHTLKPGANMIPEIRLNPDGETTLLLNGTGSVGIEYRIGSL